jgi:Protein of unknown function (DUF1761)
MSNVNVLAVVVAALSSFGLGGLWYSTALFGAAWRRAAGGPEIQGHPAKVFGLSFAFALVAAFAYALIMPLPSSALTAAAQGLLVGAGMVAASFGINYQFANRPTILWLIDGGYHSVQFTIYGLILGLWR